MPDDYFRVLNNYRETNYLKKQLNPHSNRLEDMYRTLASARQVPLPDMLQIIDFTVPEETQYLIDKVVRRRGQRGRIGIDHSEFIGLEVDQERAPHDYHLQLLVSGNKNQFYDYDEFHQQLYKRLSERKLAQAS